MIVIKDGKNFAQVYADVAFDAWGKPTTQDIRVVEDWSDFDIPAHSQKIDADQPYDVDFSAYCNMIENTLWIFNNEPIKIKKNEIYMTGSGVNWMFQKGKVHIFDISKTQIKFINELKQNWNGKNYGKFVYNFIVTNKIVNFHLNLNEVQDSNKLLIKNKDNFINSINANFEMLKSKYNKNWKWTPSTVEAKVGNIIEQITKTHLSKFLLTNVFDFKYYFVKHYVSDAYQLLSPSTKAFLSKHSEKNTEQIKTHSKKLELNVPVTEIYKEIQNIKKLFCSHRDDSGIGWRSFCIHGQSYDRTKEASYYPNFLGYKWTTEALAHMPLTIKWLKSLNFKTFQRVRVMCLDAKGFINLHKDQDHDELNAINVSITNPKECRFYLQNEGVLNFSPGVSYALNLKNYHAVINNSNVPRYHLIIHGS